MKFTKSYAILNKIAKNFLEPLQISAYMLQYSSSWAIFFCGAYILRANDIVISQQAASMQGNQPSDDQPHEEMRDALVRHSYSCTTHPMTTDFTMKSHTGPA